MTAPRTCAFCEASKRYAEQIAENREQIARLRAELRALGPRVAREINKAARKGPKARPLPEVLAEAVAPKARPLDEVLAEALQRADDLTEKSRERAERASEVGSGDVPGGLDLRLLGERLLQFLDAVEQHGLLVRVHGQDSSTWAVDAPKNGAPGVPTAPGAPTSPDIQEALSHLADLIGNEYTVSVTYTPRWATCAPGCRVRADRSIEHVEGCLNNARGGAR